MRKKGSMISWGASRRLKCVLRIIRWISWSIRWVRFRISNRCRQLVLIRWWGSVSLMKIAMSCVESSRKCRIRRVKSSGRCRRCSSVSSVILRKQSIRAWIPWRFATISSSKKIKKLKWMQKRRKCAITGHKLIFRYKNSRCCASVKLNFNKDNFKMNNNFWRQVMK